MKKTLLVFLVIFLQNIWAQKLDALIDIFIKTPTKEIFKLTLIAIIDAIFLGTDKTERWTVEEFKAYAEPAFSDGNGWTYEVVERNWELVVARVGLMKFYSMKS